MSSAPSFGVPGGHIFDVVAHGVKKHVFTAMLAQHVASELRMHLLVSGKVRHAQGQRLNRWEVREREKSERTKGEGEMSTLFPSFLTPHFVRSGW